jgi:hypothetical protein
MTTGQEMLTRDAKREYMRDYMRRKRAGLPTSSKGAKLILNRCTFCNKQKLHLVTSRNHVMICEACATEAIKILKDLRGATDERRTTDTKEG